MNSLFLENHQYKPWGHSEGLRGYWGTGEPVGGKLITSIISQWELGSWELEDFENVVNEFLDSKDFAAVIGMA